MGKASKEYVKDQTVEKVDEAAKEAYKKDAEAFNKELEPLLLKFNLGLVGIPHFSQMDNGAFAVTASVQAVRVWHKQSPKLVKG